MSIGKEQCECRLDKRVEEWAKCILYLNKLYRSEFSVHNGRGKAFFFWPTYKGVYWVESNCVAVCPLECAWHIVCDFVFYVLKKNKNQDNGEYLSSFFFTRPIIKLKISSTTRIFAILVSLLCTCFHTELRTANMPWKPREETLCSIA